MALDQRLKGHGMTHFDDLSLFRLLEPGRCRNVPPDNWVDVSSFARDGKLAASLAGNTSLTLYVGRRTPLAPRLTFVTENSGLELDARSFTLEGPSRATLRRELRLDDVEPASDIDGASFVYRLMVNNEASDATTANMTLVFGGIPDIAVARRSSYSDSDGAGRVCTAMLGYDGLFGDPNRRTEHIDWTRTGHDGLFGDPNRRTEHIDWTRTGHDELLGVGWYGRRRSPTRRAATTAELLLPLWHSDSLRLAITARPAGAATHVGENEHGTLELEVNGQTIGRRAIRRRWNTYEWEVSDTFVHTGLNQVYLHVRPSADGIHEAGHERAIQVREITLTR